MKVIIQPIDWFAIFLSHKIHPFVSLSTKQEIDCYLLTTWGLFESVKGVFITIQQQQKSKYIQMHKAG